jgi:hypothetical protein
MRVYDDDVRVWLRGILARALGLAIGMCAHVVRAREGDGADSEARIIRCAVCPAPPCVVGDIREAVRGSGLIWMDLGQLRALGRCVRVGISRP